MNWTELFEILNEIQRKADYYEEVWTFSDEEFDKISDAIAFVRELAVEKYDKEVLSKR